MLFGCMCFVDERVSILLKNQKWTCRFLKSQTGQTITEMILLIFLFSHLSLALSVCVYLINCYGKIILTIIFRQETKNLLK